MSLGQNITTIILVIDAQSRVADYKEISTKEYDGLNKAYYDAIAQTHQQFAKKYSQKKGYTIHAGIAESLANFLQSYPEITALKPVPAYTKVTSMTLDAT